MSAELTTSPRRKLAAGERRVATPAPAAISTERAQELAVRAKALADPVRIQLVDVLGRHGEPLCPCELLPLFDLSQPTLAHHLKVLRAAGVVSCHKQGLFACYQLIPGALDDLANHLSSKERT
jgi:ArsR family transcriptional regulator